MRKKIILRLLLLGIIILFLHSCRIEDETIQNTKDPENRFAAFTPKDNEKVNYSKAFGYLYNRYYEIRDISVKSKNSGDPFYTDFRVHSQLMEFENGDKAMLFAVINDHKVSGLMAGILEKGETYLRYYYVAPSYNHYTYAVDAFQNALDKSSGINSKAIIGGSNGDDIEIPEIQIPPPRGGGVQYFPPQNGNGTCAGCPPTNDGAPGGDCPKFNGCGSSGGGGTEPGTGNNTDPCAKMKAQNSTQGFKDKVAELDKKETFDKNEETGFAAAYGTTPFEPMANTANDNLKFPPGNKYFGYMHTHLDSKEGVVKIFSPADVSTFLTTCVRNAETKGTITDAYGMVITSQGNYILKYSGDGNFGIGPVQETAWQTWYNDNYTQLGEDEGLNNPTSVEKLFTQFLKEVVKVAGLEVYKSDKTNGNSTKLEYNRKDQPVKTTPCP
ncbi:hypothetical protein [Chryseobacterium bernardetii]|uniref:hypothetical protein n=1 Tax=Chryseobacterium bernardetii TaxID=1241978 RepID=UPI000F4F1811|nr:hypothetical protein [Chryseobacterium bernardetii]AZB34378.1 hypothetical protein EG351_12615 [Chryseobacterium bernardetii]